MRTIEQIFGASKIVPGAVLEDQKVALAVAGALLEADVKVMALRLLSRNSLKSLELITKEFPDGRCEWCYGCGWIFECKYCGR